MKWIKTKTGVGYVVKAKVGDIQENTREVRNRRMRKELVGCYQDVAVKNRLLVKFGYVHKKEISSSLLVFLISKEEVEMDEPL